MQPTQQSTDAAIAMPLGTAQQMFDSLMSKEEEPQIALLSAAVTNFVDQKLGEGASRECLNFVLAAYLTHEVSLCIKVVRTPGVSSKGPTN